MTTIELKKTPLFDLHVEHNAKMGAFAGYAMPLFYPLGMLAEHLHTRQKVGLFDISHMVHVEIQGEQAANLIERLCPYRASEQEEGSCRYTFFLNNEAGVVDDLIITRQSHDRFLIVANAACADKDIALLNALQSEFKVRVLVHDRAFVALQGPDAADALLQIGLGVTGLAFMRGMEFEQGWFVSRTGYTGEDGFEIAMPICDANEFVRSLLSQSSVEFIGLAARDTLRMEAGLSLYGQDLSEAITPHEAGLLWAIPKSCREGGPFTGANALKELLKTGRKRKRVGLVPTTKTLVRSGAALISADNTLIGRVTSGGFSPSRNHPIAFGLIDTSAEATAIFASVRGQRVEMTPSPLPFVPHRYKR